MPISPTAPVVMLWELRLEDMPPRGARLVATCRRCEREADIPVVGLIARFGGGEFVKRLPSVRCTSCGGYGLMTVAWPDPPYYRPG